MKTRHTIHSFYPALAIALFGVVPLSVFAGDEGKESAPIVEPLKESAITGDLGLTVLNSYNTRGIIVEDTGVVFEPYTDLYFQLYKGDGFINSFSLQAGLWSDLSSSSPLAKPGSTTPHWTEQDWDAGFLVNFAKRFTLSSVFLEYVSPSDAYATGRFINSTLSYDDSEIFSKNFSFKPHLTFLYELPADGHAGLRGHSWYFEPGVTPNYTFFAGSKLPVNFAIDVKAGLGSAFYAGKTVGYIAVGPVITVPLKFIPEAYGSWNASAAYHYYHLGKTTQDVAPGERADQQLFQFSLALNF